MVTETGLNSSIVKKKILLLYPYYWPHYKAGGPVQSLFNLVGFLGSKADFYLVSLDRDLDGSYPSMKLQLNRWTNGPQGENIYFTRRITTCMVFGLIKELKPQLIFINGMFNLSTTLSGLIWARCWRIPMVISPRGMLQTWALKRNGKVKALFLTFLRMYLGSNERWHATDEQERRDILDNFGTDQEVYIASNIPRPLTEMTPIEFPGQDGKIRLVFLSLINANKNLHMIIEAVSKASDSFSLDIYGPIIDASYWNSCKRKFERTPSIAYKGPIPPWEVPATLGQYHFFILPTLGENFGHAIFDSLATGVPVIISPNTPWKGIEEQGAGFNVSLSERGSMDAILNKVKQLSPAEYHQYRSYSQKYAGDYWKKKDYASEYKFLFANP